MKRLTKYNTDGQAMMDCQKCKADWTGKHGKPMADCTALYCRNRLLDRLVKYEDTERTPEEVTALGKLFDYALKESKTLTEQLALLNRIRDLAEADKDGRLVVLPAKTVFELTWDAGPDCDLICPVSVDGEGYCSFCDKGELCIYERKCRQEHIEQIGKTVFLTHEAAKAALEAMKDE